MQKDHEHAGFSWYLSTRRGVFNPYNVSDRISRKTWYDNVTYPDLIRQRRPIELIKINYPKPHIHIGSNALFTRLNCPECTKGQ
jgi:hypothetical protein